MKVEKVFPDFCKHHSCFNRPNYEFTDIKEGKTISIAYACKDHFDDVRSLLERIYKLKIEVKSAK